MNIRQCRALPLLALLGAAVFLSTAQAASPRVLGQTGLIRDLRETHEEPCIGDEGGGADFDQWHLDPDKTKIEVKVKKGKHRIDVLWAWSHELEEVNFHGVNLASPPVPADVCDWSYYDLEEYLFLFGIHNLKDHHEKGQPKSPHALVYVPMHTVVGGYSELADQFYLFIFKIEKSDDKCEEEAEPEHQERCRALRRLYAKNAEYLAHTIDEIALIKAITSEIEKVIPPAGSFHGDPPGEPVQSFSPHLHNGIIHGTLGGG